MKHLKHKYQVLFDDVFYTSDGRKIFFYDFTIIEKDSCPKEGETMTFHEGYGYLQNYKLTRVFQNGKFECLLAKKIGGRYYKTRQ